MFVVFRSESFLIGQWLLIVDFCYFCWICFVVLFPCFCESERSFGWSEVFMFVKILPICSMYQHFLYHLHPQISKLELDYAMISMISMKTHGAYERSLLRDVHPSWTGDPSWMTKKVGSFIDTGSRIHSKMMDFWLVVWLPFFTFPYIGNNHPNWLRFFRGVAQPPTRFDDWWRIDLVILFYRYSIVIDLVF